MVQFGRKVQRLRELNYCVLDYTRLAEVLEDHDGDGAWEQHFANLLQDEITQVKEAAVLEPVAPVPEEVRSLFGEDPQAEAACSSSKTMLAFANYEACRKIVKKYHKIVLGERDRSRDRARPRSAADEAIFQSICNLSDTVRVLNDPSLTENSAQNTEEADAVRGSSRLCTGATLLLLTCVVAFQPLLAGLAAERSQFSEASVVLAEAGLSACVGLIIAASQGHVRQFRPRTVLLFFPTALLRGAGDVLELLALRFIDPVSFLVLTQLRLVLTAAISWAILRKVPNAIQLRDCVTITLSCLIYSLADGDNLEHDGARSVGIWLTVFSVVCKVVASVWLDHALKKTSDLSIPVQSACISFGTLLPAYLAMHAVAGVGGTAGWSGWSPLVFVLTGYILVKNWLSNTVVKRFSAVIKYVLYAAAVPVAYVAELLLGWRRPDLQASVAILLVLAGVWMFARDAAYAPTVRADSELTPAGKLARRLSCVVGRSGVETPVASFADTPERLQAEWPGLSP